MRSTIRIFVLLCLQCTTAVAQQHVDILIKNAWVFDGMGRDSVQQDVGIKADRIVYVGKDHSSTIQAKQILDVPGLYLAPGFIDTHTHADRWMDSEDAARRAVLPWLYQGVTTLFAGNDGFGGYEIAKKMAEYERVGVGANVALFVGFGSVRRAILGSDDVQPTVQQLEAMKELVAQGMQEGALGFSTGLFYTPQRYAKTSEVIELAKEAAKYGAIYDTHMRGEGIGLLKAIQETLAIGEASGIPLHISHIKSAGSANWGKSEAAVALIEEARAKGVHITANQYPFEASMTSMKAALIPGWAQAGGTQAMLQRFQDPDDRAKIQARLRKRSDDLNKKAMVVSQASGFENVSGKSLYALSQEWEVPVDELVIQLLEMNPYVSVINFSMSEEDIVRFMRQPWVMTGSDGGGAHPRTYASFTRILEDYVLQRQLFSMAWGIHRGTGLTAKTFGLVDRGLIREGYYADIIIFDPNRLKMNSTYEDSEQYSEGMEYVLVNGQIVIDQGKYNGKLAGRPLYRENISKH